MSELQVRVGDKITIIDYGAVILTEVITVNKAVIVAYKNGKGLKKGDEGVYWLRGHHLPDSPEVRGAVTAKALSLPEAKPPTAGTTMPSGLGSAILDAITSESVIQGALVGAVAGALHGHMKKKGGSK